MKKYLLCFSFLMLSLFASCSSDSSDVTIELIADNLPGRSKIYVTGNDEQLGNWQPDEVELTEIGKGRWSSSFSFAKGKKLEFKITRGSWENEALNDDGTVPDNYLVEVLSDTTITIRVNLWADQVERKIDGQITGTVQYHRDFQGEGIKPRDIIVWLPPNYVLEKDVRYPVLYMHDGQNIVDPSTSAFQVDWQLDETADSLIRQELIEPIIIVGIYNTSDRSKEYSEDTLGLLYMKFIVDSMKPFIDKNYRTKPDRINTANGGGSLAGLISFMLMWDHSEIFSKAICFSPAFKVDQYDFVDNIKSYSGKKKQFKLFIDNGDNELDESLQPGVEEMLKVLKQQGYAEGRDFYLRKGKNSMHNERDWAKNIWRALIYLFGTEKGRGLL